MNPKTHNSLLRAALAIALVPILVSCQGPATPTQNNQDNGIQDIRVQMAEPVKTTSKVEQFPLPNCGGTDKLVQSLGTYATARKSATVGGKATVTGGGEAAIPETAKLKLEIQVELAYQKTFESVNSRLDSIEMSAAAGTHVVYTIVWEDQTFNSMVQYSGDGKVYEVPYVYQLSVPKIDKSYNVECPGGSADHGSAAQSSSPIPSTTQDQAPDTPVSSSQTDCSILIEGEHHNPTLGLEWKFDAINENRIIHIWSNQWENNLPEFKFFLSAGQSVSFMSGGGSVWTERPGCNGVAKVIFQRDTMREISRQDFQRYIDQKTIP